MESKYQQRSVEVFYCNILKDSADILALKKVEYDSLTRKNVKMNT